MKAHKKILKWSETSVLGLVLILVLANIISCTSYQNQRIFPDFPGHLVFSDDIDPGAKVVRSGLFNHSRPIHETYNKHLDLYAGTTEGNLYLRTPEDENNVLFKKGEGNWKWDIEDALWSENGKFLWVKQINDSEVPRISLKTSDGELLEKPYSRAGQAIPKERYFVMRTDSQEVMEVPLEHNMPYVQGVSWNNTGNKVYFVQANRLMKELYIREFSVGSRETKTLIKDSADTYLIGLDLYPGYGNSFREKGYVKKIEDGILLQSERTGYNQLYLYKDDGKLVKQLTNFNENGILQEISAVDEKNGWIYFLAGLANDRSKNALYRTSISGDNIEVLVDGSTLIWAKWSEDFETVNIAETKNPYLIEINSYNSKGELLQNLWRGSIEDKKQEGYMPEYLSLKLDEEDNTAEVLILRPEGFDPKNSYPVIEYIYAGAFKNVIPRHPFNNSLWSLQDLANEGYIVVLIDSRGTPGKGKKYQDHIYGRMGQVELHDHAKVIRKLGDKYSYLNLDKVGIMGHSWGGYFSLRAMIMYPDLYKSAHVSAPGIDPKNFRIPVEVYMGCLPQDCPETYKKASVTDFASKIKGPVQIIHGTADDDVPIQEAYRLKKAFEKAGKTNYDLIEVVGADHIVMRDPDWMKNVKQFFKSTL